MNICIFEDREYRNLLPLVHTRPVYALRCGMRSLLEKILPDFPGTEVILHCRKYLAPLVQRRYPELTVNRLPASPGEVLFINGRVLWDRKLEPVLKGCTPGTAFLNGSQLVAARVTGKGLKNLRKELEDGAVFPEDIPGLESESLETVLIRYPWDLVHHNGAQIRTDFEAVPAGRQQLDGQVHSGVHLVEPAQIRLEPGAEVKPGAVLDATGGPIYVGGNTRIMSNAVIEGPVYIGPESLIKIGAKIYENTSIGRVCKVGGEVEESIIHAWSNKQHEGFLGHAYLGTWVNIGADTNNSDLKNDYGNVKVPIGGELVDTGSQFVGLFMGDHSKSGINTMFNTGTVVGVNCNLYGAGLHPRFVPSFTWGGNGSYQTYRLEKAFQVAAAVMQRRKIPFTTQDKLLFESVYTATRAEREQAGIAN